MHIEGGVRYKKGEVVESPLPLTTMFAQKFDDLGPAPNGHKEAEAAVATAPAPARVKKGKKADAWEAEKGA